MDRSSPWTARRHLRREIPVAEFKPLLASQAQDFLQLANGLLELNPEQWSQRQLYHLYQSTTDLETYLDDFGARENRVFFPIRELVAICRWFSVAMSSLVHLDSRLPSYSFPSQEWADGVLAPQVRRAALSLGAMILRSLEALRAIWLRAGMGWPDGALRVDSLGGVSESVRLPRDLAEQAGGGEDHTSDAALIASRYLRLLKHMERASPRRVRTLEDLRQVLALHCTETQSRRFEARVHNFQSAYDSHVAGSKEEAEHPELRQLRAAASTALHFFEAVTALVHVVERHHLEVQFGADGGRLVPEEEFLGIIVNDCVVTVYDTLKESGPVARQLLDQLSEHCSAEFEVPARISLHARPLSLIVSVVSHHRSPAEAEIDGERCSAASIMQLLVLAGGHASARRVRFYGDQEVLRDLADLFAARLGEDGLDRLPDSLSYLRPQ